MTASGKSATLGREYKANAFTSTLLFCAVLTSNVDIHIQSEINVKSNDNLAKQIIVMAWDS